MLTPHAQNRFRLMNDDDLEAVSALQLEAYAPHFHESLESFAAKRQFHPAGAWIAFRDGHIVGYMFSHPWQFGAPAPLNASQLTEALPPDCYYLHDISVAKSHRGQGLAKSFIDLGECLARNSGFNRLAMISVQGSKPLWEKFGYALTTPHPAHQEKLLNYGPDAVYLSKTLQP